jgi:hypothetical protein
MEVHLFSDLDLFLHDLALGSAGLRVEVVGVRQDHGVSSHGQRLGVSGVDGAVGSLHGRARGVLEGVSKRHDAVEPSLVGDVSLGVLGDMQLSELAESGQSEHLGAVLVVNSGVSVFVNAVFGERLSLHSSAVSGGAPGFADLVLFSDSTLGGMLFSETGTEGGLSGAHEGIKCQSALASILSNSANQSVVGFGASVLHGVVS